MASVGTLWTVPYQVTGKAIRATAAYGCVRISVPTEKEYKHWETNQQPQYLSKFPHGKIPAWEGKDGFLLFESVAIMRYSASPRPAVDREHELWSRTNSAANAQRFGGVPLLLLCFSLTCFSRVLPDVS
ncbi:hypothetical protein C8J57DRAFT_1558003 [Mycena rebaudengoi]|nr:hypothetical protein C8J57DRAFT_1558003 [Mycena rebaudengoi]